MRTEGPARVIVGVSDSLAGLRALRLAVSEARRRDAVLHAVRAFDFDSSARFPDHQAYQDRKAAATDDLVQAFAKAMGGIPGDLEIVQTIALGRPGSVLVTRAHHDGDLLIVGSSQRRWWRRWFRRSVTRYCVARATCPVLAVPPDAFARVAGRVSLAKTIGRDLSTLGG
jgi:nucleotide-binding universal stress UspA family protein